MLIHRPAAPLVAVIALFALLVTFALLYVTIQAGIVAMIGLVFVLLAVGGISLFFFRGFTATGLSIMDKRMKLEAERNQHARSVLELQLKYQRAQIAAPQSSNVAPVAAAQRFTESFTDPARDKALLLLEGTIRSEAYGPNSNQIMTQADAKSELQMIADDWSEARAFLTTYYDVESITDKGRQNGLYCKRGKTVTRILTDTAVMSLPTAPPRA